ncbi:MAG TPA: hypothetical protein VFV38_28545 [Ktedonobacteraceae bacterium]|nr:hypothetical protein [Ktedonobacteraceae bacterium]
MPVLDSATLRSRAKEQKRKNGMRHAPRLVQILAAVLLMGVLVGSFAAILAARYQGQQGRQASPTATSSPGQQATSRSSPTSTPTPPSLVNGSSAYLIDSTTGRVLFNGNGHLHAPMWSATEIMTALLAIERLPIDQVFTIQQAELDEVPPGMSIAHLVANDQMSVQDLLYGLILSEGSDVRWCWRMQFLGIRRALWP